MFNIVLYTLYNYFIQWYKVYIKHYFSLNTNLFTLYFVYNFYIRYSLSFFSHLISLTHKQTSNIGSGHIVVNGYKIQLNNLLIKTCIHLLFSVQCEMITFYFSNFVIKFNLLNENWLSNLV